MREWSNGCVFLFLLKEALFPVKTGDDSGAGRAGWKCGSDASWLEVGKCWIKKNKKIKNKAVKSIGPAVRCVT